MTPTIGPIWNTVHNQWIFMPVSTNSAVPSFARHSVLTRLIATDVCLELMDRVYTEHLVAIGAPLVLQNTAGCMKIRRCFIGTLHETLCHVFTQFVRTRTDILPPPPPCKLNLSLSLVKHCVVNAWISWGTAPRIPRWTSHERHYSQEYGLSVCPLERTLRASVVRNLSCLRQSLRI